MSKRVEYPVFCPECGEMHTYAVRDTVTVDNTEREE